MDTTCIKYFEVNGDLRHPACMKDLHQWSFLSALCDKLNERNVMSVVTDRVCGVNKDKLKCYVIYVDRHIEDLDVFVEIGFCPVVNLPIFGKGR